MYFNSPLLTVNELNQHSDNPQIIMLDCTIDKVGQSIKDQPLALIPNSRFFDLEHRFSDTTNELPHTLVSAAVFTKEAQLLGIDQNSIIVCYDRWGVYSSPRVWWMFKAMGHHEVYVLEGGLPAWEQNGFSITTTYHIPETIGDFIAEINPDVIATKETILDRINDPRSTIIDARSAARFNALVEEPRLGLRKGHIPHSKNLPFDQLYHDNQLQSVDELHHLFSALTRPQQEQIYSCGSGVTASILAFAANLAGFENFKVYDGSWSEWGKDKNLPIV